MRRPVVFALPIRSVAVALLLLVWPRAVAGGIEIEHVVWGFDGQVVEHAFNPVSVLLNNTSDEPFDGWVRLRRQLGPAHPVDAVIEEAVYVTAYSRKWVQLYPYVIRASDQWTLSWGPAEERSASLPQPRAGRPAIVLLEESDVVSGGSSGVKRLPESLFPAMVTATDALGAVFLDHVPRWQEPQRRAFLDWLRRGGSVHLLKGEDGEFPEFPPPLTELNNPLPRRRVGAGDVLRHERTRHELTPEFVVGAIRQVNPLILPSEDSARATRLQDFNPLHSAYESYSADLVLLELKSMVQPEHRWGLLALLSMAYILMIFPGCKVIGQRWADYRLTHLLLLGTIAVFSMLFAYVGRRGHGEATTVHSAAVARAIGEDAYDVTQWSNLFVTAGDDYQIAHAGRGRLYSACSDHEAVDGTIRYSLEGRFVVDIPPFSSRNMAHRTKIEAPVFGAAIESLASDGDRLRSLVIRPGKGFPREPEAIHVLSGDRIYQMTADSGRLQLGMDSGSVAEFLGFREIESLGIRSFSNDELTTDERYEKLMRPLVSQSLGIITAPQADAYRLPSRRFRLFVYAPMPKEFFATNPVVGNEQGRVLYVLDVFPPDNSTD